MEKLAIGVHDRACMFAFGDFDEGGEVAAEADDMCEGGEAVVVEIHVRGEFLEIEIRMPVADAKQRIDVRENEGIALRLCGQRGDGGVGNVIVEAVFPHQEIAIAFGQTDLVARFECREPRFIRAAIAGCDERGLRKSGERVRAPERDCVVIAHDGFPCCAYGAGI